MRLILLALLIAALSAGGYFLWGKAGKVGTGGLQGGTLGRPTEAAAEVGAVNFSIGVAGEIGPAEQVSVRPEVNGRIRDLPVDVSDRVRKGELLFSLDDRDLSLEVETRQKEIESSHLQLDKARLAMDQAKRDYEREQELFDARLLSEQAYETTQQRYESAIKDHEIARNSIERAEKDLALAEERLSKTRIMAPFDCTVLTRPVSAGQAVSGSGGFNSGTEVLTIADLSSMVINAHVNQADVTHLSQGMAVNVEVDAVPGLTIEGEVERVAPQATVKNNIKGYGTRILLKNTDPRVQPGMTANITIPVSAASDVLTVPLPAVFSEQGERYVFVKQGDTFERRNVVVGLADLFNAEIKSGLSAGETVALELPPGMAEHLSSGAKSNPRMAARTSAVPAAIIQSGNRVAAAGNGSSGGATSPAASVRPAANQPGPTRPVTPRPGT